MSDHSKRDGIAEILRSGRAPGAIVRGNGVRISERNRMPVDPRLHGVDAGQSEARAEREVAAKFEEHRRAKAEGRLKKAGNIRFAGSMPMDQYHALVREVGRDAVHNDDRIWKDTGRLVDS